VENNYIRMDSSIKEAFDYDKDFFRSSGIIHKTDEEGWIWVLVSERNMLKLLHATADKIGREIIDLRFKTYDAQNELLALKKEE